MRESRELAVVERARRHRERVALVGGGESWTFERLLGLSAAIAARLLGREADLGGERVALLAPPLPRFVAAMWGIWRAGGVAVPLPVRHPPAELGRLLADCDCRWLLWDRELESVRARLEGMAALPDGSIELGEFAPVDRDLPNVEAERAALMLYTSGTTGRPKGVVHTHASLEAMVATLVEAWRWSPADRAVNVLPLHHVHGLVNVVGCALWSGARCEMAPAFDPLAVWERLASGELTVFMAVPTVYSRLIDAWRALRAEPRRRLAAGASRLRLTVSGSAALPAVIRKRWREITGHTLLERYGMTEIGMALSQPLRGERLPGDVGVPLPGVEVRLRDEDGGTARPGEAGEIEVRSPCVFREYWRDPEATERAFDRGWFRTGDLGIVEAGRYRILGRLSQDILKSGGEKLSALEIEAALREHPAIADCAVVGLDDAEWGQQVAVALELVDGHQMALDDLRRWARSRLAAAKIPRRLLVVERLPRNAVGKVVKPAVAELFPPASAEG